MAAEDDWKHWLDRYGGPLLMLARQWGASAADSEDILQEVLFRLWVRRKGVVDPVAYLFSAVRNAAIDLGRRTAARRKREMEYGANFTVTDCLSVACPDAVGDLFVPQEMIKASLAELPPEQREVLVMKIWAGLTFAEIGKVTEVSANTAASRYRYAISGLRRKLELEVVHG